jgi:hypothetical protein
MECYDAGILPNTKVLAQKSSELVFWDGGRYCRGYDGAFSYSSAIDLARTVTDWLCGEIAALERGLAHLSSPSYPQPRHADDLEALSGIARGARLYRDAVHALSRVPEHLVDGDPRVLLATTLDGWATDALVLALTRAYEIARRDLLANRVLDRFSRQELAYCGHALSVTLRHTTGARHERARELHAAWVELLELRYMSERGGEAARHFWKQGS